METALDLSRWREAPRGVGYRRWTIIRTGLRQISSTRFFRILIYTAWVAGTAIAALGFAFSQSIATGGWLEAVAHNISPRAEALVIAMGGLVALYPDVCVGTVFTLIFWAHSYVGLTLTLLALTAMITQLITRDRASNALTIYLSRPLTSGDYLLGKLGMIVGVILLVWTGPLLLGWLLSMVLSSERDMIVYSFEPFMRALAFNGIALVVLAPLTLGISALSRSAPGTMAMWLGLWLAGWLLAGFPNASPWLRNSSFMHDLGEMRRKVLRLDSALSSFSTDLPILSEQFTDNLQRKADSLQAKDVSGATTGLVVLVVLSSAVCFRRIRPE
ncbi:MAG TPA: ABC transporter permease subunit [Opitutaceae bacterium]|nr:ABC transporter permease subunit [Opitutaceae bacterium]